ncbi:hypothetical protein [Candidatus Thiodictyon syntrophicum]|nr:hypothetical protein [Candidatus Thiodictyon syntrophicum]
MLAAAGLCAYRFGAPERYQFAAFLTLFSVYLVASEITWRQLNGEAVAAD